jgi:HlyD family secretion protein
VRVDPAFKSYEVAYLKQKIPWVLAVLLLVAGSIWSSKRPEKVEVVAVATEQLAELLAVSGQVRGRTESRLAPEVSGTLGEVLVEEGDVVTAGQILASLNQDRLRAAREQAKKQVEVAQAQLSVASRGPLPSELEEVRSEVARREQVAQAGLEVARQRLAEAEAGPRTERKKQAKAELGQATADRQQLERDLKRQKELFQQGAISKQSYEQATTALTQAKAAEERASQGLSELQTGTRPEQLEQARQEVSQAETEVQAAQRTGQSQIQQLLDRPRPEDVALAQAQLAQAQAALALAEEQLEQTVVKAPYDGVIGRKLLDEGDQSGPNAPVLTLASQPNLEIRVDIDESERNRLKVGQQAVVRANGFPDPFQAEVVKFAGEVDSVKGTIEARLHPQSPPDWLVPGQTVDVNIVLSNEAQRLVVPLTSVVLIGDTAQVLAVVDGRVQKRSVHISSPTEKGYLVDSGLEAGEMIVRYPQGVADGETVRTERTDWP